MPGREIAPEPSAPVTRTADLDGVAIVYDSIGRGDRAVVFIHGWSCNRTFFDAQMEGLRGAGLRLIALDLPGHGESEQPDAYSMDLFARSVAAVMDDAGVREAVVVGHSNGAPVARQFARLFPERTAGVVAIDGALRNFFTDPAQAEQLLAIFRGEDWRPRTERFIDAMLETAPEPTRLKVREAMLATPREVMIGAFEAALDPAIWSDDPIPAPLLVVVAESPFWTPEYEAYVRTLSDDVEYRAMTGVSHFLMMEDVEGFNAILKGFLARIGWLKDGAP